MNLGKLLKISQSKANNLVLEFLGVNYLILDTKGDLIYQNKPSENCSLGFKNALKIDPVAWKNTKRVIQTGKQEVLKEKFRDKFYLSVKHPVIYKGKCVAVIILSVDITDQEKTTLLKEEFITSINHDIKTPLFGISALINILKSQESNGKKKQWLQGISDCVEGLNSYISKILDVISSESLLSTLQKSEFNLKKQFDVIHQMFKPILTHKNLLLKIQCEDKNIFSYEWAFQQIFLNLISNAIRFTEKGEIKVGARVSNHLFKADVMDTGCGIAKKNQKIIFEKFKKITPGFLSSGYTGSGLGLSIVHNLIQKLKGKITLKSALKKGSTFSVQFPV